MAPRGRTPDPQPSVCKVPKSDRCATAPLKFAERFPNNPRAPPRLATGNSKLACRLSFRRERWARCSKSRRRTWLLKPRLSKPALRLAESGPAPHISTLRDHRPLPVTGGACPFHQGEMAAPRSRSHSRANSRTSSAQNITFASSRQAGSAAATFTPWPVITWIQT